MDSFQAPVFLVGVGGRSLLVANGYLENVFAERWSVEARRGVASRSTKGEANRIVQSLRCENAHNPIAASTSLINTGNSIVTPFFFLFYSVLTKLTTCNPRYAYLILCFNRSYIYIYLFITKRSYFDVELRECLWRNSKVSTTLVIGDRSGAAVRQMPQRQCGKRATGTLQQ
mgnify:CR=1 FL=1